MTISDPDPHAHTLQSHHRNSGDQWLRGSRTDVPVGAMNPDTLRMNADAGSFVHDFFTAGKPVAAICHAPCLVVEAGAASGRRMTTYPSIRTDVMNAGATWVDESVVTDRGLVTSRSPKDLDDFTAKMVVEFSEGAHARPQG